MDSRMHGHGRVAVEARVKLLLVLELVAIVFVSRSVGLRLIQEPIDLFLVPAEGAVKFRLVKVALLDMRSDQHG